MKLFTPGKIKGLDMKNRMVMSTIHLGYTPEGRVNDRIKRFYEERANGGVSSIIIGGVTVERQGSLRDMVSLEDDTYIEGFSELVNIIHENDCNVFVQLFHAGRNGQSSYTNKPLLAPSPIASPITREVPEEMTEYDLMRVKKAFGAAAVRAKKAGVDGVEISASAGYLLASFLSPATNNRTDRYGGSPENLMRYPQEVAREIREAVGPDYPVTLRISGDSMLKGGYDLEDMKSFCMSLDDGTIDAVHVTGGWHEAPIPQISAHLPEGTYALLASEIKKVIGVPVIASNRINNGQIAEEIISESLAEFVAMGRGLIADPQLPNKIRDSGNIRKCIGCNQGCIDNVFKELPICCVINGMAGIEYEISGEKVKPKKMLVAGGGVAGMDAARLSAEAGHEVILCTKDKRLGGQIHIASVPPDKRPLAGFAGYLEKELVKLGVEVRYETNVDGACIEKVNPEHVVVATGSKPIIPGIPGLDKGNVLTAAQVLSADKEKLQEICKGKIVVVGGGAVGLETATYLGNCKMLEGDANEFVDRYLPAYKEANRAFPDISVVEMLKRVGSDLGGSVRWIIMNELKELGIKIHTNSRLVEIREDSLVVDKEGLKAEIEADTVVIAIGSRAFDSGLVDLLEDKGYSYTVVGDAKKPGKIMNATKDAVELCNELN